MFSLASRAQQGISCGNSISLDLTPCISAKEMGTNETWFQLTAQTTVVKIRVSDPTDTSKPHIHRVVLYDDCNGTQLNNDYATSKTDGILELWYTQLIPGKQYIVETQEQFGLPVCDRCTKPGAGTFFDVCITHMPNGTLQPLTPCVESCGNNLFVNGDFEAGNTGFYVDQAVTYHNCTSIPGPFYYGICSNANILTSWWQEPAHSGISYFVDDGVTPSSQPDVVLWSQNVQVVQGKDYCLSFWFANIDPADADAGHPPHIIIDLWGNNTVVQHLDLGNINDVAGSNPNPWIHISFVWSSGSNTAVTVDVRSFDNGNSGSGNDLGMDDFEMSGLAPAGPTISASLPNPICTGQTLTLSVPLTQYETVVWQPGNFTTSSITVTPSTTTTYMATVSDACNTYTSTYTVQFIPFYPAFTYNPPSICVQTPVTFSNNTVTSLLTTYLWDFGDNTTSTATSPTHIYSSPGTYTVTLTASNSCGTLSLSQVVNVIPSTSTYNVNCCSGNLPTNYFTYDEQINGPIFIGGPLSNPTQWTPANGTIYVRGIVTIVTGASLNIAPGTVVEFDPLSRLVVQPGALLTVNSATLKGLSVCGTMWQGIEVWGDKNYSQSAVINPQTGQLYQGKAVISNSIIQDAHNGVVCGRSAGNNYDPNKGGGILVATGTQFLNCGYSVRATPHPHVSNTRITSCSFTSTTLLDPGYNTLNNYTYPNPNNQLYGYANGAQRTYTHVQTVGVQFLLVGDNTFNNSEYGVVGIHSSLRVIDWDGNGTGNTFSNTKTSELHGNIFASPFYANRVERNIYSSTSKAIHSVNGNGDRIINNRIISASNIAIGAQSSRAYTINDNSIGDASLICPIGVVASSSGIMGGMIGYTNGGNLFTQCNYGVVTFGNNPFLQIHCNNHDNQPGPTLVTNSWYNMMNSPLANQGRPALNLTDDRAGAGNKFIQTTPVTNEIFSGNIVFDYYRHNADQFGNSTIVTPTPIGVLNNANVINTNVNETSTSCIPSPPCTNCRTQLDQLDVQIAALETEKTEVSALIDGGQTQVLLDAINSNMSGGQLKNLLLANSPLSDQVLLAYIAKNGTPPGLIKDVVVPNSPVSASVRPALYSKINSMPNGVKNQIIAAQSSSNRTPAVVDAELQVVIGERQFVYNQQQYFYADQFEVDTTVKDSMYLLLLRENTEASKTTLASAYLADENYPAALNAINSLAPTNAEDQAEKDLLMLLYTIHSVGRNIYSMTFDEVQAVRNFANFSQDCPARASARVILFVVFGEPIEMEFNPSANRISSENQTQETSEDVYLGECYPNPANDKVSVGYNIPEGSTGMVEVFDVNGKVIYSQTVQSDYHVIEIATAEWSSGMYLCRLIVNSEIIGEEKIVISNGE